MTTKLNIFPAPRKASTGKTRVDLKDAEWIVLPSTCSRKLRERIMAGAECLSYLFNRSLRVAASLPPKGNLLLNINVNERNNCEQGYELKLSSNEKELTAGDESGAFYGFLAFVQLIEQFGANLPALTINDSPDFPRRGVMLDVSRCKVPTMETCKQLIERLSWMRINQVQLYIEHTFAFAAHKSVWHDSSPFTHEEILELDQFCADRFIELVPNFNSFGHFARWLKHPEYRHLAECPKNANTDCLAPNAASIRFLDELYDEYLPNFTSSTFNVGCDETWELGKGRSKARAEKTSTTKVYFDFLKKIHKLVTKKGRRMQFWGDIILHQPELIKELPKDILALCWGYDEDHPYSKECRAFSNAKIEYHVCPGTSAWNSITGRTDNCLANLKSAAYNGLKHGATGFLNTDWGDGGHHQTLPISYLGFAAGAAFSWHLKKNCDVDLASAINRIFFQDPTDTLGQFCLDLGRTLNKLPGLKRGNCSVIHQLLFSDLRPDGLDISGITKTQYRQAEEWISKLHADLLKAHSTCDDRNLVMNELNHALEMSRHAIHRGQFAEFGIGSAKELRNELQNLVMSHEEQWLARNRRGGLYESSTRLRNTCDRLPN